MEQKKEMKTLLGNTFTTMKSMKRLSKKQNKINSKLGDIKEESTK